MIIRDLSQSFHPCPKIGIISNGNIKKPKAKKNKKCVEEKKQEAVLKTDFCIMPQSTKYSTKRTKKYNNRHEVFFGRAYRFKSIQDGLIVFLTDEDHEGTNGVHGKNGNKLNRHLKKLAQKAWMSYYNKTEAEFRERYGQNCL